MSLGFYERQEFHLLRLELGIHNYEDEMYVRKFRSKFESIKYSPNVPKISQMYQKEFES